MSNNYLYTVAASGVTDRPGPLSDAKVGAPCERNEKSLRWGFGPRKAPGGSPWGTDAIAISGFQRVYYLSVLETHVEHMGSKGRLGPGAGQNLGATSGGSRICLKGEGGKSKRR